MIRKCIPAAPITSHLPDDVFVRDGEVVRQYRDGDLLATHELASQTLLTSQSRFGPLPITAFFFEEQDMAASLTVVDVTHNGDGSKTVIFDDGSSQEVTVLQLNQKAMEAESLDRLKDDIASYWKARSTDFSSSTPIVGKTFQKDMSLELGQMQVGEV